jgi:hypothetical protein
MLEVRGPVVLQSMLLAISEWLLEVRNPLDFRPQCWLSGVYAYIHRQNNGGAAEHAANCVIVYAYTHTRTRARTRG